MTTDTTPSVAPAARRKFRLFGEWSWEKYIPGVAGVAVLVYAVLDADGFGGFVKSDALQTSLLLLIGAYLSEMRYRLFADLRNN